MSFLLWSLISVSVWGQEPGFIYGPQNSPENEMLLHAEFLNARGLTKSEVQSIAESVNRVQCLHRAFSPSGKSLSGDGDLLTNHIAGDLNQFEFRSQIAFDDFNPFGNHVLYFQSGVTRTLIDATNWVDGQVLKFRKPVVVGYDETGGETETVYARDEIKQIDDVYPATYIIRETVFTKKPFHVYFLCQ